MAGGAAVALAGLASGALGAVAQQTRVNPGAQERHQDTSTVALATSRTRANLKAARRNAQEERMMAFLTDPQVMGLICTFGGLFAATRIPWAKNPQANGALAGAAAATAMLLGLGRAGVGDLTTAALATTGGLAAAAAAAAGAEGAGGSAGDWPLTWHVGSYPVASAFGPIPGIQRGLHILTTRS